MLKSVLVALALIVAASSVSAQEFPYIIGPRNPNGAPLPPNVTAACLVQGDQYVFRVTNNSGRPIKCIWGCLGEGAAAPFKWTDTPRLVPPGTHTVRWSGKERIPGIQFRTNANCVYAPG